MDATELSLLAGICAEPLEDTPRLVYADWLDEHGRYERAEFIRVQCELARVPAPGELTVARILPLKPGEKDRHCVECRAIKGEQQCEHHRLYWRSQDLLDYAHRRVPAEVPNYVLWFNGGHMGYANFKPECHRGFVDALTCSAADFLAHCDELIWYPFLSDQCDLCDGLCYIEIDARPKGGPDFGPQKMYVFEPPKSYRHGCQACGGDMLRNGTGRISRPCPPTAQPITRVRLTTPLAYPFAPLGDTGSFTNPLWPGVAFEPSPDTDPALLDFVSVGGALVPASGWQADIENRRWDSDNDSFDYTPGRAISAVSRRVLLSLTYYPGHPSMGVPHELGEVFGPIHGTTSQGAPVIVNRAIMTDVRVNNTVGSAHARVTIEVRAQGV